MLNDLFAKRLCNVALVPSTVLKHWEEDAIATCKSAEECKAWTVVNACGGCLKHLNDMLRTFKTRSILEQCEFSLSTDARLLQEGQHSLLYRTEMECGRLMGKAVFVMIELRLKRGLWYTNGYPQSMAQSLSSEASWVSRVRDRFLRDRTNSKKLLELTDGGQTVKKMQSRNQFQTTPVKRYDMAFSETGGVVRDDIKRVAEDMVLGPLSKTDYRRDQRGAAKPWQIKGLYNFPEARRMHARHVEVRDHDVKASLRLRLPQFARQVENDAIAEGNVRAAASCSKSPIPGYLVNNTNSTIFFASG